MHLCRALHLHLHRCSLHRTLHMHLRRALHLHLHRCVHFGLLHWARLAMVPLLLSCKLFRSLRWSLLPALGVKLPMFHILAIPRLPDAGG